MQDSDLIVGLDIGTTKICVVIGVLDDQGKLEIVGIGTAPSDGLRKGVVINIESTQKAVLKAVDEAEIMAGRQVRSVYAGVAGSCVEGINSRGVVAVSGRGREIDEEDIKRVIEAARTISIPMDREVLHLIPQEYIVDDQGGIKDPMDMMGIRLEAEIHIITSSITSSQNLIKSVNRAGIRVEDTIYQLLASASAVLTKEEKNMGVLLIDLGGGTTDVLTYLAGAPCHTDVITVGGEQVTSDISIVLKTPLGLAEKLKKESGNCFAELVDPEEEVLIPGVGGWPSVSMPKVEIANIIQPRMEEIFELIKEKINKKGYLSNLRGGIVLTGGGSLMPGVSELASKKFGIPARIGYPFEVGGLVQEYKNPMYSTSVGLVMYVHELLQKNSEGGIVSTRTRSTIGAKLKNWMREFL